jgi:hypothetical protein
MQHCNEVLLYPFFGHDAVLIKSNTVWRYTCNIHIYTYKENNNETEDRERSDILITYNMYYNMYIYSMCVCVVLVSTRVLYVKKLHLSM